MPLAENGPGLLQVAQGKFPRSDLCERLPVSRTRHCNRGWDNLLRDAASESPEHHDEVLSPELGSYPKLTSQFQNPLLPLQITKCMTSIAAL